MKLRTIYDIHNVLSTINSKTEGEYSIEFSFIKSSLNAIAKRIDEINDPVLIEEIRCMGLLHFENKKEIAENLQKAKEINPNAYDYDVSS